MKPLNSHTEGCNPISSNCVIWQGPDIECIKLCKGDTVSDVVFKLATELCTIMEYTSITTYDLSCLELQGCDPKDFPALIQLIIDRICNIPSDGGGGGIPVEDPVGRFGVVSGTCPDCEVIIAPCFYYKNEFGDDVTTMNLTDYARTIGNKVCELITQITNINVILTNHEERITALEDTPAPEVVLPQVVPTCVLPALPSTLQDTLTAVEQQFCQLRSATGLPSQLFTSMTLQCINLNNSPTLGPTGSTMSSLPGWINTVTNLSDAINNMWITICDLRSAVTTIQNTCCPTGCDGIEINMTATFDGTAIVIYLTGAIPVGFADCDPSGNLFSISDTAGNAISQRINVTTQMNNILGTSITVAGSSLNLSSDFTIHTDACVKNSNTNSTCQFCIDYVIDNTAVCPALNMSTITDTSIAYSFTPFAVPATYTVQLWNSDATLVLNQNITNVLVAGLVSGSFTGLTPSTSYRLRIVVSNGVTTTECPYSIITTTPVVCNAPTGVVGAVDLPVECVDCGSAIGFVSNPVAGDGYYIDDTSQYLLLRSGGTFNDIYTDVYQASMTGVPSPSVVSIRNSATTLSGATYISYNDNAAASASIIYHYDSTGTLINTITLPFAGAASVRCNSMTYSEFDGKIYFVSWPVGALGNPLSVYQLNPVDDSYVKLVGLSTALIGFPNIYTNPLNGHLMFANNLGSTQIGNPSTDVMINTGVNVLPQSGLLVVNRSNGYVWVMRNGLNTIDIWDVSGVTPVNAGTATAPVGFTARAGSANGAVRAMTYYPGDGTPGTDRMFAVFNDAGLTVTDVIEFDANAPYTATTFKSLAYQFSPVNVLYAYIYNKLLLTYGTTLEAFTPTDGTTSYANVTIGAATNLMWPFEDNVNNQVVYYNFASNPANNIFWIGLDTTNALFCSQGLVNYYDTSGPINNGPYVWDEPTLSWIPACTFQVVDSGSNFVVTATFPGVTIQSGVLIYSTNGGVTWKSLGSNKTSAEWLAGVTYVKADIPSLVYDLRIAFLTNDNCGLASRIDNTYNP